ncbi:hypothetical protein K458DRAFT_423695 [Lentithecium fluviatile CBS 122367]|uniref:Uncharacterized protein n=1 Tax=Lentithecium fluviatile CBS 122367 TaxID=1168545 RepID=A0A6G1II00_9PLEO|nr:hypothetical protein K458DRAFT_423695 [Lentithecium fluviatile CBS 122367]
MGLLSFLQHNKRVKAKKLSIAEANEAFEFWVQNVTSVEIRDLFLKSLTSGCNEMLPKVVEPTELAHFNDLVADSDIAPDGQIELSSIVNYLASAHTTKSELIKSTASTLEILIVSHACFPFSSLTPLNRDAFCRAVLLLIARCEKSFKHATWISGKNGRDLIRKRTQQARLMFLYSALARPPTGLPTNDDILDVVSRVEYPWYICRKNLIRLRPIIDFLPLAERLEPSSLKDPNSLGPLPVSILEPLRDLAEAFPPRYEEPAADLGFGGAGALTIEEFCYWAKKVRLLEALDQLFSVFIPKAKCQCPKHRAMEEKVVVDTSDSDA